ncbi:MAG TPA: DUF3048 C-terminal domain-containing protein [Anaerolineaceae bacterium]|nr:DUF3048 C-terminal domain-containing protein [Anaerolineaceae bacterium]
MKIRLVFSLMILATLAAGCQSVTATPTALPTATLPVLPSVIPTSIPSDTPTIAPSSTPTVAVPTVTATPAYPANGYGPTNFPTDVDPLTGLQVSNPTLLNRRPIVIKVENLPREDRPQWGLTLDDITYEYYTEQGGTRFAAIFYGQDATQVGPIRSARFFDFNVVQMYKGVFAFGYAYADLFSAIMSSDFANRVILEGTNSGPALSRFDPNGHNFLIANTTQFPTVLAAKKINNDRQNLDGMSFNLTQPSGGNPGSQLYVRYSAAIYNRWDYNPATGTYARFVDAADDPNRNNEQYVQLTDRLTSQPVTASNVVMVYVDHQYVKKTSTTEVFNMKLIGTGKAYVARDGQLYQVTWKRAKQNDVLTFVNKDGTPFALKPGQTWVEVLGNSSTLTDMKNGAWKFTWLIP